MTELQQVLEKLDLLTAEVRELRALVAPAEALLDVAGAARLLGMTVVAVRRSTTRGNIPCRRIGRLVRYQRDVLLGLGEGLKRRRR